MDKRYAVHQLKLIKLVFIICPESGAQFFYVPQIQKPKLS